MSHQEIAEFADAMLQHFPPFRQWEDYQEKAWADTMASELSCFPKEVLARAQREIIRTRKPNMPRPPMVSECIQACLEARRWIEADASKGQLPAMRPAAGDEWSTERVKLAYDLIKSSLGKEAGRDGWILSLWGFCRINQRVPQGPETERCKRDAQEFDTAYADCVRGAAGPLSGVLEGLGAAMLAKRESLAAEVLRR